MNRPDDTVPGRILLHGRETGEVSTAKIDRRAHEIALVNGRDQPNSEDHRRALDELQGRLGNDTPAEDAPLAAPAATRDPSEPLSVPGRQTPERTEPDSDEITARLVEEGVDEAQHDQMLAARRRRES